MNTQPAYKIFPLGDAALIVDFGNSISDTVNDRVISLFKKLQQQPVRGMTEAVPAYSSLTIYYDLFSFYYKEKQEKTVFEEMKNKIITFLEQEKEVYQYKKRTVVIPVCYDKEYAADMEWITDHLKLTTEEFIRLHTSKSYRVFMLGFLPGFPYMGEVDDKIMLPRKLKPENVIAGSVGIAGKQTGIYPFNSPGGWQVIGRTPLKVFNKANTEPALVQTGDFVNFFSISKNEFENIKSRNA
ncbi:MAG TPA: 5-oxoprolinase subunit PxpB [Chitinophagaceae bacterium]|nr:5-oxoprolinase subunit PxpB [Chitinophagaceae bacterium]